ncbi:MULTISPECIES: LpqB family beta-propeller domain-containing protein [Arthrobacter]|uniref:LpqB family beta-propeller domain-containing protein n=1 Tax=Arthrobacter TaxID=1663 RepID=UPI00047C19A2|nr:LpqB family beta-propeller domain-containing protein [Arthrobacter sp. 35/47]
MTAGVIGRIAPLVILLLLLTSCSSIPTAGPVGTIEATAEAETGARFVNNPPPPREGARPGEILNGFLVAGIGVSDNYSVARSYLTPSLAQTWAPEQEITIYRSDFKISSTPTEGELQLQVEVAGYIDAAGIRRNVGPGTTESMTVRMEQVQGEWRVAEIPTGIMISAADAENLLQPHELYYYSSSYQYWVPDVRWFVNRQGIATNIVKALINGPAPYLQGAVTSAFPENTALAVESVPIESGTATVDFTQDILTATDNLRRQQMEQQLRVTLTGLNTVNSVELRAGQPIPYDIDPDLVLPELDPAVPSRQIVISENELAFFEGGQLSPAADVPSVAGFDPVDPAMSYDGRNFAFLNDERTRLLATGEGQNVRAVTAGSNLTPPSYDPANWIWTAGTSDGRSYVRAIPPGGSTDNAIDVLAPWLGNRTISEIRISRDGARALIVAQQSGQSQLLLSGVSRSEDGVPQTLSDPISLNPPGAVDTAKWVTETSVVVADTATEGSVTATLLPFASEPDEFRPLAGLQHLSAGTGRTNVFAQSGNSIYGVVGNTWTDQGVTARDPSFAG